MACRQPGEKLWLLWYLCDSERSESGNRGGDKRADGVRIEVVMMGGAIRRYGEVGRICGSGSGD